MSVCREKGKRILLAGIFAGGVMAIGAAPAAATGSTPSLDGASVNVEKDLSVETKKVCKTVYVIAATAPSVTVTVGGKPTTIDTSAFATASVKVCVEISATASVDIWVNVDTRDPLCPIVTGNVSAGASATGGGISVEVSGLDKYTKPLTISTEKLELLPVGAATDVPLLLVVCDP